MAPHGVTKSPGAKGPGSVGEVIGFFRRGVADARFVARHWRYHADLGLEHLTISFTFMCPCGNDIVERFSVPHPDLVRRSEYKHILGRALRLVLRELEGHIAGDGGDKLGGLEYDSVIFDEAARIPPAAWFR